MSYLVKIWKYIHSNTHLYTITNKKRKENIQYMCHNLSPPVCPIPRNPRKQWNVSNKLKTNEQSTYTEIKKRDIIVYSYGWNSLQCYAEISLHNNLNLASPQVIAIAEWGTTNCKWLIHTCRYMRWYDEVASSSGISELVLLIHSYRLSKQNTQSHSSSK